MKMQQAEACQRRKGRAEMFPCHISVPNPSALAHAEPEALSNGC